MAAFDPAVPEQQQKEYENAFHGIEQPTANVGPATRGRALGQLFQTAGHDIGEGFNQIEKEKQDYIGSGMANDHDNITSSRISELASIDDVLTGRKPSGLLSPGQQPVPPGMEAFPGQVQSTLALKDSGHLSDTYYKMIQDQMAKKWRSEFPTERDFIDTEMMHISWRDPANKVVESMTSDINAMLGSMKEAKNKLDSHLLTAATQGDWGPNGGQNYMLWKAGKIDDATAINSIAQRKAEKNSIDLAESKLRLEETYNKVSAQRAERTNSPILAQSAANAVNDMFLHVPEMQGTPEGDRKLLEVSNAMTSGALKPRPEQGIEWGRQVQQAQQAWELQMIAEGNKQPLPTKENPNPRSRAQMQGTAAYADMVHKMGEQYFHGFQNMFAGPLDLSIAHAEKAEFDARADADTNQYVKDHQAIRSIVVGARLGEKAPAFLQDWFTRVTADPNLSKDLKPWTLNTSTQAIAQPQAQRGAVFTLGDIARDAQTRSVPGAQGGPQAVNASFSNVISAITNPKADPETRMNAARAVGMSPELFEMINSSGIDSQGRLLPGKSTLLSDAYNAKTVHEVKRYADPAFMAKFLDTGKQWSMNVMKDEWNTINSFANDPAMQISWNSETHQWSTKYVGDFPPIRPDQFIAAGVRSTLGMENPGERAYTQRAYLHQSIDKLNLVIRSIAAIAKETGQDPNALTIQYMMESGMTPKLDPRTSTMSAGLWQSITMGNLLPPPKKTETADK